MLPLLIIFFRIPIDIAVGSVILALLPGSLISTFFNARQKKIDYLAGILLEIPTMVPSSKRDLISASFAPSKTGVAI